MKAKYPDIWGVNQKSFFMDQKSKSNYLRPLVPVIPVRPTHGMNIWVHDQHDTDQDGVPNYRDCQPLNPNEHFFKKIIRTDKFSDIPFTSRREKRKYQKRLNEELRSESHDKKIKAREKRRITSERAVRKTREKKMKALEVKSERKKMIESGLSYTIIMVDREKNKYAVVGGRINKDRTAFIGKPKRIFEGTYNDCRIWGKKRGLKF